MRVLGNWVLTSLLVSSSTLAQDISSTDAGKALGHLEQAYADFNDADGAVSLIDSDPGAYPNHSYAGKSREAWQQIYAAKRAELLSGLRKVSLRGLAVNDVRAIKLMRAAIAESSETPDSPATVGDCKDAQRTDLQLQPLQKALYACFTDLGNSLRFENSTVTRVAALDLLTRIEEPQRRKSLFLAFVPLWQALNSDGGSQSPYRRMVKLAASQDRKKGSPIDVAARTIGIPSAQIERWLERILDTWRRLGGAELPTEPWDYHFENGAAERELGDAIPRRALQPLNQRYYADLGLDLAKSRVIYDLDPRPGKAPLAYSDFVRRGRVIGGVWQPSIARVSASYERGDLGSLNELVHENGHVAHMLALHTRPAFMDLGDPVFFEAFADVPSWSVYEPAWQQKYLGRSVAESASLRALYSSVMLDVAWALFDLRMLRDPNSDPNLVWTQITSRYLNIKPHPEFAWWAVRVQLIEEPGYMVNYGLGAVITADIRKRIAEELGPFQTGDARWYEWISQHLLVTGEEHETKELLRQFLGRSVSPQALIDQLQRIATRGKG